MGSLNGFLDFQRKDFVYRSIATRIQDYDEILIMQDEVELKKQAARCMSCEIPYCFALGCPISNRIPEWVDYVFKKDINKAYECLAMTNSFPEFTGRICPALCETSCSLSINLAPVTIKQLELFIIEKAFEKGVVKAVAPVEIKSYGVAIVGSGPTGLAAAESLRTMGYDVTVFEKSDEVGGLLRYGIPDFKLPKWVIDRRVELMKKNGIKFKVNTAIGTKMSTQQLMSEFDAGLLCIGAGKPRDLHIKGRNLKGVHFALSYLTEANLLVSKVKANNGMINAKGKRVLVIGGGDTGSDCIGTANRQGAEKVTQIEIMPMPSVWKKSHNPHWPNYPHILRTSSSQQEGCVRDFGVSTKSFISKNGTVVGVNCVKVEWSKDIHGNNTMTEIEGSEFIIDADLILIAMGFSHVEHTGWLNELGIEYDDKKNIRTTNYMTSVKGIFAAGDASSGASLVCRNIDYGKKAARVIDDYLSNRIVWEYTSGHERSK